MLINQTLTVHWRSSVYFTEPLFAVKSPNLIYQKLDCDISEAAVSARWQQLRIPTGGVWHGVQWMSRRLGALAPADTFFKLRCNPGGISWVNHGIKLKTIIDLCICWPKTPGEITRGRESWWWIGLPPPSQHEAACEVGVEFNWREICPLEEQECRRINTYVRVFIYKCVLNSSVFLCFKGLLVSTNITSRSTNFAQELFSFQANRL